MENSRLKLRKTTLTTQPVAAKLAPPARIDSTTKDSKKDTTAAKRDTENISVNVRIRPFNIVEKIVASNGLDLVTLDPSPPSSQTIKGVPGTKRHRNLCFAFDRVFDEDVDQQQVYETTTKPVLAGLLSGYNATVFAYGTSPFETTA